MDILKIKRLLYGFNGIWILILIQLWKLTLADTLYNPINGIVGHQTSTIKPLDDLVDKIESIDVTSNQLVITTSKAGPPETMKLSIQVMDIQSGLELPPINLTGILLILTRGRYTVNFLSPSHWYGIVFRSEQQYGGILGPIYTNEEKHLIKTHKEDGSNMDGKPLMTVFTKRLGNRGRSLENLMITMKWEVHPDERPNIDVTTNITLYCKEQIKFKQLRLFGREVEKSVEVKLDNHFEIMEFYNQTRQIMASITPKNCPRICWNAKLVAETVKGIQFTRNAAQNCEDIVPISVTTTLRDYLSYETHSTSLIFHTNYTNIQEDGEVTNHESDAYVQISAIPIPEPAKNENITNRFKVFSTSKEENDFMLDHLEPNRLYAIQYTYGKQSPFAYAESRRFIVETQQKDSTAQKTSIHPLNIEFEPIHLRSPNSTKNSSTNETISPKIKLNSKFKNYEIGVDVDPFCDPTTNNGSHFWLTKDKPTKELKNLPIIDALCSSQEIQEKHQKLCHELSSTTRKCLLSPEICYTANVVVDEKGYSMERRCIDLVKHYPIDEEEEEKESEESEETSQNGQRSASQTHVDNGAISNPNYLYLSFIFVFYFFVFQ